MNASAQILQNGAIAAPGDGRRDGASPDGNLTGGTVETRVVSDFSSPGITRDSWNALVAAADAPVYLTYEWQSTWWKYFGGERTLRILLFLIDGELRGIAPLFAGKGDIPGTVNLCFIGAGEAFSRSRGAFLDDGPSDYLDILADPASGDLVGGAMADYLAGNRTTICRLDMVNVRPESSVSRFFVPAARRRGLRVAESVGEICPYVVVDGPVDDFIGGRAPGVRRRLNQASRLLSDRSAGYRENDDEPLGTFLDDLVGLHQHRWNNMGFPGLFFDPASALFQRTVAELFSKNGWLWRASLRRGPACIAARMGFRFQGRVYEYLSGFDDAAPVAKKRPGLSLWLAMYRSAQESGAKVLDLLRGDEKYKFELTDATVRLTNYRVEPGPARTTAVRFVSGVLSGDRLVRFLMAREVRLFRVQAARHGAMKAVGTYIRFRWARLARKRSLQAGNE